MKKKTILFLLLIINLSGYAQSAYYDALLLKSFINPVTGKIEAINAEQSKKIKGIFDIYKYKRSDASNPFLDPFVDPGAAAGLGGVSGVYSKLTSGIGGLNVTTIADGLAKFLVERAKEELSISFFQKFKKELDKQEELKTLFPNTFLWLQSIDSEIYNYSAYLSTLREAFQKDLSLIIPDLKKAMDLPKYNAFFNEHPKLKVLLNNALLVAQAIHDGKHPGDIIKDLADQDSLNVIDPNLKPAFQTLNLFSQSIRSRDDDRYWISPDSLKLLFKDETIFKIYLGLIYQKADDISFTIDGGDKSLKLILKDLHDGFTKLKSNYKIYLETLAFKAEQTEIYLKTIREKNKNLEARAGYQDYYAFYTSSLDLLESLSDFPDLKGLPWTKEKGKYFTIARKAGDLFVDVNQKNYSSGAFNLFLIFQEIFEKEVVAIDKEKALSEIKSEKKKNSTDTAKIVRLEKLINLTSDISDQNLRILKYATFAAQVASAESSDQVKEAITAVSLPAGSASIKRQTPFNISINAYLGTHWGNEYLQSDPAGISKAGWSSVWGISAPIGIAFSTKINFPFKGGSASLFTSLIDLGAVASFRLKNDSTEQLPEIKLENIFAPGIYFIYGIPKVPISIGYGWQMGPQLRSVNIPDTANPGQFKNELLNGYRWSIFLAVDIPMFNLFTKPKK